MTKKALSYRFLIMLAFLCIYLIWGTTYLAIVVGLEGFPPFLMASIRFLVAGLMLVSYSLFKGEGFPKKSSLIKNAFIALVVLAGGQGLLIWSEQHIASGYASVLVATLPIWFVVMDKKHWKLYFSNPYILGGVALGFAGIIILFRDKLTEPLPAAQIHLQLVASVAVLFGAMCWVVGTLYHRSRPAPGTLYQNLGWQLLCGAVICLLISLSMNELDTFAWSQTDLTSWSAVLYLSVAGSIMAYIAYTWLLNEMPSAIVGTYAYINPVVAVFLGWLLVGEVITTPQMVGMLIILVSAILINLNRGKIKPVAKAKA